MAKRKKTEKIVDKEIIEEVKEEVITEIKEEEKPKRKTKSKKKKEDSQDSKIIASFKTSSVCNVKTECIVPLRQFPIIDDRYIVGNMSKGKIYKVVSIVNINGIEMYKLDDGNYILSNDAIIKL